MRTGVISVLAIAGTAFATTTANPANQISDGQVQWTSASGAPAYGGSTPVASSPASPASSSAAAPSYAPSGISLSSVEASSSSPAGAISVSTVVPPESSAVAPSYPAGNATAPLGTGTPGGAPTGKPTLLTTTPAGSPTSPVGAGSTSSGPAQASGTTNAAGSLEAQVGLTGAAFAGLLALLA